MSSWIVALCEHTPLASAEEKLYLACLIRRHGAEPIRSGDTELTRRHLGISRRVASRVVAELLKAGYLTREQALPGGRTGRPASEYRVKAALLEKSPAWAGSAPMEDREPGGHFEAVIEYLLDTPAEGGRSGLGPRKAPMRHGAANRLSCSNRLVLMVLLGRADRGGVVRRLGPSELVKLAGLSKVSLQGQLRKLVDLQYLRAVVAGVTGSKMFGVAPGAYFLRLGHAAYRSLNRAGTTFICCLPRGRGADEAETVFRLFASGASSLPAEVIKARMGSPYEDLIFHRDDNFVSRLAVFFDGVGSPGLPAFLQMRLEDYAACLLSEHWDQLGLPSMQIPIQLREQIRRDIFPLRKTEASRWMQVTSDERQQLEDFIFGLSLFIAQDVRWALSKSGRLQNGGDMHYVLLPATVVDGQWQFVVEAAPKVMSGAQHPQLEFRLDVEPNPGSPLTEPYQIGVTDLSVGRAEDFYDGI
jgi:hypothetical protein